MKRIGGYVVILAVTLTVSDVSAQQTFRLGDVYLAGADAESIETVFIVSTQNEEAYLGWHCEGGFVSVLGLPSSMTLHPQSGNQTSMRVSYDVFRERVLSPAKLEEKIREGAACNERDGCAPNWWPGARYEVQEDEHILAASGLGMDIAHYIWPPRGSELGAGEGTLHLLLWGKDMYALAFPLSGLPEALELLPCGRSVRNMEAPWMR